MIAHADDRTADLEVLQFEVEANRIIDPRDHEGLKSIGVTPADAASDWQRAVAAGEPLGLGEYEKLCRAEAPAG